MDKMGTRIREKRIEYGYTMEELGKLVGVQPSAVNKWEKGMVTNIKRSTVLKLAKVFHCNPSWIMGYDEPKEEPVFIEESIETWNEDFFDRSSIKGTSRTSKMKYKLKGNADQEEELLYYFNSLPSEEDKKRVLRMMKSFVESAKEEATNYCG